MSRDEARMAIDAGVWALGLVAVMPNGQGPIIDGRLHQQKLNAFISAAGATG